MDHEALKLKLETMKGKSYEYANNNHLVKDCIVDEANELFVIKTNRSEFRRKFESMEAFLKYWKLVTNNDDTDKTNEALQTQEASPVEFVQENSLADELVTILKDNITKVQADKGYIAQAQTISANINSIMQVQRLKLDLLRHYNGKRKR